jgi:hypothetical protein
MRADISLADWHHDCNSSDPERDKFGVRSQTFDCPEKAVAVGGIRATTNERERCGSPEKRTSTTERDWRLETETDLRNRTPLQTKKKAIGFICDPIGLFSCAGFQQPSCLCSCVRQDADRAADSVALIRTGRQLRRLPGSDLSAMDFWSRLRLRG